MQDMYANSQQSASGVQALLEAALNEGRALANSPATPAGAEDQAEEEQEAELTIDQLSNAAALASSILASHGSAEVSAAALSACSTCGKDGFQSLC